MLAPNQTETAFQFPANAVLCAPGALMTIPLKFPQWQQPLADAILEKDPERLREKLQQVVELIEMRIDELRAAESADEEFRALYDGLMLIRSLKKGEKPV